MRRISLLLLAVLSILAAGPAPSLHAQAYTVTNLVSDGSVPATTMDAHFLNPWAMSVSSTWWVSTANSGYNYVISSTTDAIAFKVIIPAGSGTGTGTPAGSVTTSGASGMVLSNGAKASFLFSTLDGLVTGWNGGLGTATPTTLIAINNSSAGASYPGLAILNTSATASYILAPNFGAGNKIEVYDQTFKPATLSGGTFTDPNLPSGYSPWSVHILNNQVWVAYALRAASAPYAAIAGPGDGIVDVFDVTGKFVNRAITGGNLNAPWGIAFAPATGFGIFSGDLLVGNFGDGKINVYDPKTYTYIGQLMDSTGKSLVYGSLWELLTGGTPVSNGTTPSSGGALTNVYFTAGLASENHGLLGAIASTTVAGATPAIGFSAAVGALNITDGSSAQANLSIVPVNGFTGAVTFTCSNLPPGASCSFSPATVNLTATAVATTQMSVSTTAMTQMGSLGDYPLHRHPHFVLTFASLLPFCIFLFRRRRSLRNTILLMLPLFALTLGGSALILGCSSNDNTPPTPTPTGQTQFTVTAMGANNAQQSTTPYTHRAVTLTVEKRASNSPATTYAPQYRCDSAMRLRQARALEAPVRRCVQRPHTHKLNRHRQVRNSSAEPVRVVALHPRHQRQLSALLVVRCAGRRAP